MDGVFEASAGWTPGAPRVEFLRNVLVQETACVLVGL